MRAKAVAFLAAPARAAGAKADAATPEIKVRRVICCFIVASEDNFCRNLHHPAAGRSRDAAESRTRIRIVRRREVGVIQSVECFPAKFQPSLLAEGNALE